MLRADLWMPIRFTDGQRAARRSNNLQMLGRLAAGASVQSAEAELRNIFAALIAEYPALRGDNVRVAGLHAENTRNIRKPLVLLFGAVVMVLLIASTNVAALLFARGVQRQRELAVRSALGASAWDTMRPALVESALLTAVSAVVGLVLAAFGVKTIGLLAAARIPQLNGLSLNNVVLAFALLLSSVAALVCGAAPGWRSTRVDPQDALRSGRGGSGQGTSPRTSLVGRSRNLAVARAAHRSWPGHAASGIDSLWHQPARRGHLDAGRTVDDGGGDGGCTHSSTTRVES